jgi:hypothetical protein
MSRPVLRALREPAWLQILERFAARLPENDLRGDAFGCVVLVATLKEAYSHGLNPTAILREHVEQAEKRQAKRPRGEGTRGPRRNLDREALWRRAWPVLERNAAMIRAADRSGPRDARLRRILEAGAKAENRYRDRHHLVAVSPDTFVLLPGVRIVAETLHALDPEARITAQALLDALDQPWSPERAACNLWNQSHPHSESVDSTKWLEIKRTYKRLTPRPETRSRHEKH